ncbi:UNVERIFIED_ORG: hypothetical protein GGD48_005877 [Rhizobium etli]
MLLVAFGVVTLYGYMNTPEVSTLQVHNFTYEVYS